MAILKRPMFRKGGSANSGIMDGLERRNYANSNWEDIAKAYGSSYGQDTSTHYGPRSIERYLDKENIDKMIESYTPTEKDWSWLEPKKEKITLPSGEEVWLEGGMPIEKEDLLHDPYRAPEFVTMPATEWAKSGAATNGKKNGTGKKDDGGLDGVSPEDAKETFSERNLKYLKMMAPGMQKRMMNDALAAASEAFGESTGDTKQDIANAISAAAAGMGGTKDIYDKVSMLTLSGEIQKDIEASKTQKLSNYEFLYNKMMSGKPEDKAWAKTILKQDRDLEDLTDKLGKASGYRRFVTETMPGIEATLPGDEKSIEKLQIEDLKDGKYYLGPPKDQFITIKGGKIIKEESGLE